MSFNSHTTMSMAEYGGGGGPVPSGSIRRQHMRRANSLGDQLTSRPLCRANGGGIISGSGGEAAAEVEDLPCKLATIIDDTSTLAK
jgi:hypothetical protein